MSHHESATGATLPAPIAMTLLSITCVQLSDAFSVPMIDSVGPVGSAWIRVTLGALLLLAAVRPDVRSLEARHWRSILVLGVLCAGLSVSFMSALQQLSLGTAVSIEFLGPLAVALCRGGRRGTRWPMIALVGVVALTEPWRGGAPVLGVLFAVLSAACWAGTIMCTARVGAEVPGMGGIALAMPVAALCLAPWGAAQAGPHLRPSTVALGLALALLMPVLPYVLELAALRRLPERTFATMMSFEPLLAVVVGAAVLGQQPSPLAGLGIILVVAAGVGATKQRRVSELVPAH